MMEVLPRRPPQTLKKCRVTGCYYLDRFAEDRDFTALQLQRKLRSGERRTNDPPAYYSQSVPSRRSSNTLTSPDLDQETHQ